MPLALGTQTDVLLKIEDCLDNREAVFIRLMSGQSVMNRMRHWDGIVEEDAIILDDPWIAGLLSFRMRTPVNWMDRHFLTSMIFNLASDAGERVLLLTDQSSASQGNHDDGRGSDAPAVAARLGKLEASSPEAIVEALYRTRTRIVISDILPDLAYTLFDDVRKATVLQPIWIQLPWVAEHSKKGKKHLKTRFRNTLGNALNRGKLAVSVMTAELA